MIGQHLVGNVLRFADKAEYCAWRRSCLGGFVRHGGGRRERRARTWERQANKWSKLHAKLIRTVRFLRNRQ